MMKPSPAPVRRYDKGERRYRHVGKGPLPRIVFDSENPRKWFGKCPSTLNSSDHRRLVNEAIPGSNGDRDLPFPKTIYAVHEGAIYEGQTTDRGRSYHGYPYHGKLPQELLDSLRQVARNKGCEKAFDRWVNDHITVHGTWT